MNAGLAVQHDGPAGASRPLRAPIAAAVQRMLSRWEIRGAPHAEFWKVFDLLTDELLAELPVTGSKRFSGICRDGSPWQFCAVLGGDNPAPVRFLTEVGRWGDTLARRTSLGIERIPQALRLAGHQGCEAEISRLAEAVPQDEQHFAGLWIGVAAGPRLAPRFRAYANIGWGTAQVRWLRLVGLLDSFAANGFAAKINEALPPLLASFQPAGFAVTLPSHPPHVKIYFRPFAPPWFSVSSLIKLVCADKAEGFAAGLEGAFGLRLAQLPWRALVLSLSGPADGAYWDIKLDFCGHCLFRTGHEAMIGVERLAAAFGFNTAPCYGMIEDMGVPVTALSPDAVAFIGIGANRGGPDQVNVYFSPDAVSPTHEVADWEADARRSAL